MDENVGRAAVSIHAVRDFRLHLESMNNVPQITETDLDPMDPSKHILPEELVRYSIVIPTRGRQDSLENCLHSIRSLDYSKRLYEVIVVFDGDTENYRCVEAIWNPVNLNLRSVIQERTGPAAARNYGARLARGKYLGFTDDDCIVPSDWLIQADLVFDQQPDCLLGGRVQPATSINLYSVASHVLLNAVYAFYNSDPCQARFFASCHMFMPRFSFHQLQGFDSSFWTSEDRDLCARWSSQGWPMWYQPSLVIQHNQRDKFVSFVRRHFGYGKGGYRFYLKQARQNRIVFRVAPKEFYCHLATHLFKLGASPRNYLLICLLLISQIASLFGFVSEAASSQFHSTKKHLGQER